MFHTWNLWVYVRVDELTSNPVANLKVLIFRHKHRDYIIYATQIISNRNMTHVQKVQWKVPGEIPLFSGKNSWIEYIS